jgi:hypothetical protein
MRPTRLRLAGLPLVFFILLLTSAARTTSGATRDPFPDPHPVDRAAAVALVADESPAPLGCLTPHVQRRAAPRLSANPAVRRALALLQRRSYSGVERIVHAGDGTPVAYTDEPTAFDRVCPVDLDGDGTPDLVQRAVDGLNQARSLLVDQMHLTGPGKLDVVLLELGAGLEGYLLSNDDGATIVLDGSRGADGDAIRAAAAHQYAHAVASAVGSHMPPEWGEALASWTTLELAGEPDGVISALFSTRLERLGDGLLSHDLELAAGNAIWFAFLKEAYGLTAVSVAVQELARGGSPASALDRALGRVSDDDLATAFREFQLWSILVGPRADPFHFSFAHRLAPPRFASTTQGLPALSVHADPSLAVWGAAQIRIVPDSVDGGLGVRFEGGFGAVWEADLLLLDTAGALRRLALDLTAEGWGEANVPLDGVVEALLLVRNVKSQDGAEHRYTYAAHRERAYPFEMASIEAHQLDDGVGLEWETSSEKDLVGFNLLRVREGGGVEIAVNPVWIPALGDLDEATSYQFVDRGVEAGVAYIYRVQGITVDGLTSLSEPLVVRPPATP